MRELTILQEQIHHDHVGTAYIWVVLGSEVSGNVDALVFPTKK